MAVTIFGVGCGAIAVVVCIAYAVWYLAPQREESEKDAKDTPSADSAD